MVNLLKGLLFIIIKILHFSVENVRVLLLVYLIILSAIILGINFQPYSWLIITIYVFFTVATLKMQVKEIKNKESVLEQMILLCFQMPITLITIVFFYAMVKSGFMSDGDTPLNYMKENFKALIVPSLSSKHPYVDFMMILSYFTWLGCYASCVCMQPKEKEKEKSTLREIFENNINEAEKNSKLNVKKSKFSVKRANRKGYLSK